MSATSSATPGLANEFAALLRDYQLAPNVFDALVDADGTVRAEWTNVLEALRNIDEAERRKLYDNAQRILRENGVTFVAQDDADSTHRPWRLDLLPMVIAPDDWAALEIGLVQRARLLNELLGDLYGEQRTLTENILPPNLVFGNPRFLPACMHIPAKQGTYLHLIAFDVARAPDGRWWVLGDRTEMPSGAGYALENRVVTSRCLPEVFAGSNVRRHAHFFRAYNQHVLSLTGKDEPLAVFLTRGPAKRTYFDHAYLARYLGHEVVEGSDLTVRDDHVYLKTIEGLKQVDLIFRAIRSEMADPLELRADSMLGVPGLLQSARTGTVTVGNQLGSGVIESPGFLSFLPAACRHLLGEDLAIPSVATWWCGQESERRYVLERLDELLVRRISTTHSVLAGGRDGRVSKYLTTVARDRLVELVEHAGHDFVGQEPLALSTAPVWTGGTLKPEPSVLRLYVAATADGYEVLPGALTRISHDSDPNAAWLAVSDLSKDTWVMSEAPVEPLSLLANQHEEGRLRRGHRNLPSRAADNLFWLGRYTERAEAAVRLFRSLVIRLAGELGSNRYLVSHERVVSLLVIHKHISSRRAKRAMQEGRVGVERELWAILFDPESRDGLANVLGNVKRTAEIVRDRLSFDAYQTLMVLTEISAQRQTYATSETEQALRLLNRLVQNLAAFSGMAMENMTRGYGWRFLDMGRRIERIRAMNHLVQNLTVHGDPESDGSLELLLELADSRMTYRGRYHAAPRLARVLDLVLADESNPRSIAYQLATISGLLAALPTTEDEGVLRHDQRIVTELLSRLQVADVFDLATKKNRFDSRIHIDRLCRDIEKSANELSDGISQQFFSHSAAQRVSGFESTA
jgi:uncharacterized circularly permuted ATP-grasp superfamily protein/uncharacterized alpha-E superfamily protein